MPRMLAAGRVPFSPACLEPACPPGSDRLPRAHPARRQQLHSRALASVFNLPWAAFWLFCPPPLQGEGTPSLPALVTVRFSAPLGISRGMSACRRHRDGGLGDGTASGCLSQELEGGSTQTRSFLTQRVLPAAGEGSFCYPPIL